MATKARLKKAAQAVTEERESTGEPRYHMGAKKYVPKVDKNERSWGRICEALATGPKTLKQLQEACRYDDFNHTDFVGYMVRGGHIAPVE